MIFGSFRLAHTIPLLSVAALLALSAAPPAMAQVGAARYHEFSQQGDAYPLHLDLTRVVVRDLDIAPTQRGVSSDILAGLSRHGILATDILPCAGSYSYVALPKTVTQGGAGAVEAFVRTLVAENPRLYVQPIFYDAFGKSRALLIYLPLVTVIFDAQKSDRAARRAMLEKFAPEAINGSNLPAVSVPTPPVPVMLPAPVSDAFLSSPEDALVVSEDVSPDTEYHDLSEQQRADALGMALSIGGSPFDRDGKPVRFLDSATAAKRHGTQTVRFPANDASAWLDDEVAFLSACRNGFELLAQINALRSAKGVRSASADAILETAPQEDWNIGPWWVPNDLSRDGWDIHPDRWAYTDREPGGTRVVRAWGTNRGDRYAPIAVIDNGAYVRHHDLFPNIIPVYYDSNLRWNVRTADNRSVSYHETPTTMDSTPLTEHGTHCVSSAAARGQDGGNGPIGTAWLGQVLPIDILVDSRNTSTGSVKQSIFAAYNTGCRIGSFSTAINFPNGRNDFSILLSQTRGLGMSHFSASSNRAVATEDLARNGGGIASSDGFLGHPAMLAVGMINRDRNLWFDSDKGVAGSGGRLFSGWGRGLQFVAPGEDMQVCSTPSSNGQGQRFDVSGTSVAAPHVAGIAALIGNVNPTLTPDEIYKILRDTASKTSHHFNQASGQQEPYNQKSGWGLINAQAAVKRATDYMPTKIAAGPGNETFCLYTGYVSQDRVQGGGKAIVEMYNNLDAMDRGGYFDPTADGSVRLNPPARPGWRCIDMAYRRPDNRIILFWRSPQDNVEIQVYDRLVTSVPGETFHLNNSQTAGLGGWGLVKTFISNSSPTAYALYRIRTPARASNYMIWGVATNYSSRGYLPVPEGNPAWMPADITTDRNGKFNVLWTNIETANVRIGVYENNLNLVTLQTISVTAPLPAPQITGPSAGPSAGKLVDIANDPAKLQLTNETELFTASQLCISPGGIRYVLFKNCLGGTIFWAWPCSSGYNWAASPYQWRYGTDTYGSPFVSPTAEATDVFSASNGYPRYRSQVKSIAASCDPGDERVRMIRTWGEIGGFVYYDGIVGDSTTGEPTRLINPHSNTACIWLRYWY